MKTLHKIAFILLVIGGLNWLLVGLGGWDVVSMIFASMPIVARIIFILVGLSAVVEICTHKKNCVCCSAPKVPPAAPTMTA
jgi:uncharacterized protein